MFTDLKSIESEISQFKSNMNSVDGLMSAVKDVCSKMDHQISQGDQYIKRLEEVQDMTSDRLHAIALDQENISNNQMISLGIAVEKQADRLMQIQRQFESNIQAIFQANRSLSLEVKGEINDSIHQLNESTNVIVQMTRSWIAENKELHSKAIDYINDQINKVSYEQKKSIADVNSQIAKLAVNLNQINQYYDDRTNKLHEATSAIDKKVKLFGIMTVAGILVIGLLVVLL